MYIGEILAKNYFYIRSDDSIRFALGKMNELYTSQLPVVDEKDLLGILTEDHLLSAHDDTQTISSIMASLRILYLYEYQHVYEALQYMDAHQLETLPVLDKDNGYIGVVNSRDLLTAINGTLGNRSPGAIIVLELGQNDVSFSQIARIFESENVRILNTAIRDIPDTAKIEMTLKVDKQNISTVIASLWRFDYVVKGTFNDGSQDSDIRERYDILMNYLNL